MNFFKPVSNKPDFNSIEQEIIAFWKENQVFQKSIDLRKNAEEFVFYEGPPTANGRPGVHHVLARTFKDLVCRYQTMKGKKVERKAGWDEHGLPVEIEVEKQLGFNNERSKKEQIEEFGLGKFNELCAESTQKYINEWEQLTERMAYWVDFKNAYRTSDPQYIEKVWGIIKKLYDKGFLYKGFKVVPWACDSGTVVSQAEVAQGYKDVVDETAYVKFQLTDESAQRILKLLPPTPLKSGSQKEDRELESAKIYMLAWTTTPWTLPSNMALAVGPDIEYVVCKRKEATSPPAPLRQQRGEQENCREVFSLSPIDQSSSSIHSQRGEQEENSWQTSPELWEKLKPLAIQKRKEPTEAENALWEKLRDRQINNAKFRRQHSIDRFIVDFYCSEAHLIIEVDGSIHEYTQDEDKLRQEFLESLGHQVIRFSNEEVLNSIDKVLEKIKTALKSQSIFSTLPAPLSVDGEGLGVRSEFLILSKKRWKAVLGEEQWEVVGKSIRGIDFARQNKTKGLFRLLGNDGSVLEVSYYSPNVMQSLHSYNKISEEVARRQGVSPNSFENNVIEQILKNANRILIKDSYRITGPCDVKPLEPLVTARQLIVKLELQYKENIDNIEVKVHNRSTEDINLIPKGTNYKLLQHEYKNLFGSETKNKIVLGLNGFELNETFVIDDADSGTGIVHIAPAFGQDDFECYKANNIREEITSAVNSNGTFNEQAPEFLRGQSIFNDNKRTGQQEFTRINKIIIKHLDESGLLLKTEKYEHSYPHNWRTNNPLIYYLRPSWYVATSKFKNQLIEANQKVNWFPGHIKEGRFGQWLENNIDWSISRERFWGSPLPIWENSKGEIKVIGSFDELEKLTNKTIDNPHKPHIDEITWTDEHGETWKRVPEVLDCWFDSGSMPVASNDLDNPSNFRTADYICEAVDQTRGWFYTLLAIAVGLSTPTEEENRGTHSLAPPYKEGASQDALASFGAGGYSQVRAPYKNVLCLGHILDRDGQKMSKSKGNVVSPWDLFTKFGADPVRWFMIANCSAGNPIRFDESGIAEVMRRFILPLWNTYSFFVLYANLDKITAEELEIERVDRAQIQPIDLWILTRLAETNKQVSSEYEAYEFSKATLLLEKFVDDLSNVWVRANRNRFWNTNSDSVIDLAAYNTLHSCLLGVCHLAAPFMPLITETIYQNLKTSSDRISIHLSDWTISEDLDELEKALLNDMQSALEVINVARSLRQELGIKIRQPLSEVIIPENYKVIYFEKFILSELNVKKLTISNSAEKIKLNTEITDELKSEGLARELIHSIQGMRKNAGFEVSDRIKLIVDFKDNQEIIRLLNSQKKYIMDEVLALEWIDEKTENSDSEKTNSVKQVKINGQTISVAVEKI